MPIVLKTPEGKKVVVNRSHDEKVYEAPHNPPNTGTKYISGTDLYVHEAGSGKRYYYSYYWSLLQGEEPEYTLLTEKEVKEILIAHAGKEGYGGLKDCDVETAECYFPDIFDEDA